MNAQYWSKLSRLSEITELPRAELIRRLIDMTDRPEIMQLISLDYKENTSVVTINRRLTKFNNAPTDKTYKYMVTYNLSKEFMFATSIKEARGFAKKLDSEYKLSHN